MTVSYVNTFRDLLAFARYHYIRTWILQLVFAVFVVITLQAIIRTVGPGHSLAVNIIIVFVVECMLIAGFLVVLAIIIVLSLLSPRYKSILTAHTITVKADGLTAQTPFKKTICHWDAIRKVARTKDHLFMYVSKHAAHIIPRHAVDTQQDWDSLYALVIQYGNK